MPDHGDYFFDAGSPEPKRRLSAVPPLSQSRSRSYEDDLRQTPAEDEWDADQWNTAPDEPVAYRSPTTRVIDFDPYKYDTADDEEDGPAPHRDAPATVKTLGHRQLASGMQRLMACAIDFVLIFFLPLVVLRDTIPGAAPYALMVAVGVLIASYSGLLVLLISGGTARYANTVGKHLMGIRVARAIRVGQSSVEFTRVGAIRTVARLWLHILDTLLFVGFLWVFKANGYNRTWADSWTHIVHIRNEGDHRALPKAPKHSMDAAW